jgi:uncharacterized protein
MLYLDTSIIVAVTTPEAHSGRVRVWLGKQDITKLHVSRWTIAEYASALSIKTRTGQISPQLRADASAEFAKLTSATFIVEEIEVGHFIHATRLVENIDLGLRAPDGLHLAVSTSIGATLCTLDKKLADAATALGAKVHVP